MCSRQRLYRFAFKRFSARRQRAFWCIQLNFDWFSIVLLLRECHAIFISFVYIVGSLIFIFSIIRTLDYPDFLLRSRRVRIIEVRLHRKYRCPTAIVYNINSPRDKARTDISRRCPFKHLNLRVPTVYVSILLTGTWCYVFQLIFSRTSVWQCDNSCSKILGTLHFGGINWRDRVFMELQDRQMARQTSFCRVKGEWSNPSAFLSIEIIRS